MWSALLELIPGAFTTLNGITSAISNAKIAAINATTEQERISAQERVSTLQAQRDVLIADTAHSNIDLWVRTGVAIGPSVYLAKIFIYDKVLGLGSTDPLDPNLWQVVMVVLGFYFLYSGAIGVSRILKS